MSMLEICTYKFHVIKKNSRKLYKTKKFALKLMIMGYILCSNILV